MILTRLLPLPGLLKRSVCVCVCARVLLSCWYLWLCSCLCATQKSFTSSSQNFLFILQHSPRAELPKWYFYREKREGRKRAVGGKEECERVKTWKIWQDGRTETKRVKNEGRMCQVCVVLLSMSSLEKCVSWRFHKTHKRNAFFDTIYQTSARSMLSLIRRATHKSPPHINIHICKKIQNKTQHKGSEHIKCQFIQSTKTSLPLNLPTVAVQ